MQILNNCVDLWDLKKYKRNSRISKNTLGSQKMVGSDIIDIVAINSFDIAEIVGWNCWLKLLTLLTSLTVDIVDIVDTLETVDIDHTICWHVVATRNNNNSLEGFWGYLSISKILLAYSPIWVFKRCCQYKIAK